MPCDRPDCQHRPVRIRVDRPRCKSCARKALVTPEWKQQAVANLIRGRRKHLDALTPEQASEYRWLTNSKNLPAAEALRIVTGA